VFLPEKPDGANRIPLWLTGQDLAAPKLTKTEVRVLLPRFKAESKFLLNGPLTDLGMKKAFDALAADFTGMYDGDPSLYISHVLHKAFVDVNEEGTEAAAATAVVIKDRAGPRETVFRADRPFVYVIRDNKTGAALFMGRYSGPAK
jgi:serpin B